MPEPAQPLLNPVLNLKMEAVPEAQTGGGKSRDSIKVERLQQQIIALAQSVRTLYDERNGLPVFDGRAHILVRMFAADSLAPSYTPDDLFSKLTGCQLVAPFRHGYLVEAQINALPNLARVIDDARSIAVQCDISRVRRIDPFSISDRLRGRSFDAVWDTAPETDTGRLFTAWLVPFLHAGAKSAVLDEVQALATRNVVRPTYSRIQLLPDADPQAVVGPIVERSQSSIARAMRGYRQSTVGRAIVALSSQNDLLEFMTSGVVHRLDPVRPIITAAPGEGPEPSSPQLTGTEPIVGIVDGGLHARSYTVAEAWKAPPLVKNSEADRRHGNAISSLVVQGHAWNPNRKLPALTCRIGSVQAVPHPSSNRGLDEQELVDYLAAVIKAHPEAHVWNISANQYGAALSADEVSPLGHTLGRLARAAGILPIISVGNMRAGQPMRPAAPADCESAITVGGRGATTKGEPGATCPKCLPGPGPDGMLKPDLSWFSELRMLGGVTDTGSSYAAALVSSLAAHTFANLKEPTPDLVKALLINAAERGEHHAGLGWGSPYREHMPWSCAAGSVTLAWTSKIMAGANYYWNDVPIPPELIRGDKLFGRAKLTAILKPLVSPLAGANYFASRLQTSLQYKINGEWSSLLGTMKESTLKELDARQELKKWQPVRCHTKDFTKGEGLSCEGPHLRVYARLFMRDLYQFGWSHHSQAGPQEVAFVLTLWSADPNAPIYNSTVRALGNFVESAVLNQEIGVET